MEQMTVTYISETYKAEGWTRNAPKVMSDRSVNAIIDMAKTTPVGRITEDWVLSAASAVVGTVKASVGPQFGQERVISVGNWKYFQGFGRD